MSEKLTAFPVGLANMRNVFKRVSIFTTGGLLVVAGIIGLMLPILPGMLLLVAGALVLRPEWPWLYQVLGEFRDRIRQSLTRVSTWQENCQSRLDGKTTPLAKADETDQLSAAYKILIFDEDIQELARLAEPFESRNLDVCKCASLETAMRSVEREEFDFALVDQVSLDFEGRRVIRHLVRYNFPMPFIVLARPWEEQCHQQALELGAADYLEKPVSTAKIDKFILNYLGACSKK